MIKNSFLFALLLTVISLCKAQQEPNTQNIVLVTFDGLRWQEVFTGADKKLINNGKFVEDVDGLNELYWSNNPEERRMKLMPFMWSTIARHGQIYGNRNFHNNVNVSNIFWFSYPGYNEILTGISNDKSIFTNQKKSNPNVTVLEYLNSMPAFHNKVAVFGSWDVFPYILNRDRSGIFINAGYEPVKHENMTEHEILLNTLQVQVPSPWKSVRLDAFTHHYAMEYMKTFFPRVLEISYGETDDNAHDGKYDGYLMAINRTDQFIEGLWNFIQSDEHYRNKTTLIITTDHGRGHLFVNSWKKHGRFTPGSGQTWFAVMGPDTDSKGEVKVAGQFYQNQLARTLATLLNINYNVYKNAGLAISQVVQGQNNLDEPTMVGMLNNQ